MITPSAGDSGPDVSAGSADAGPPDAAKADASPSAPDGATDGATEDSSVPSTLGLDPAMGWSSWSFIRNNPTEASIHAQAQALHDSNLSQHGYVFVNIDDFYYENPAQTVDAYGRWMVDATKFPGGMAAMGTFVHNLGLKFGMLTADARHPRRGGHPEHAHRRDELPRERHRPRHRQRRDTQVSIGEQLQLRRQRDALHRLHEAGGAGVHQLVGEPVRVVRGRLSEARRRRNVGRARMSRRGPQALEQSGRTIHFELSNSLAQSMGSTWATLCANGWRIDGDVECYCSSSSSYPLTDWSNVSARFSDVLGWQAFSHAGARNDLGIHSSSETGDNDGLTSVRKTDPDVSLGIVRGAAPPRDRPHRSLELGDLALLTNDEVIAIDHAGVPAKQVAGGDTQVWFAPQPDGSVAVGLFNLGGSSSSVTASWSDLGLTGAATVRDVWARADIGSFTGSFETTLDSHAVALLRISP